MSIFVFGAVVIVLIIFSSYLLIYNILYISVNREIHFYGQLKTLGTTERQIKSIIYKQIFKMDEIGIPIGILFGAMVSFLIVPYALKTIGCAEEGVKISFSPAIFVGAAVFSMLTSIIGG